MKPTCFIGRRARIGSALLVAFLLAACGSTAEDGRASTGTTRNRFSSHLSATEFAFLVGYGQTVEDQPIRDWGEQILDKRCMNKHGLKYILDPSAFSGKSDVDDQPYVPGIGPTRTETLAVAQRRRVGYHLYSFYRPGKVPPNDRYVRSLSPAEQARYMRALFGPQSQYQTIHLPTGGSYSFPTAGCVAHGQRRLYGSPKAAQEVLVLPGALTSQLGKETTSDPAVEAKVKPWSRCVSAATGIRFASPDEIVERLKREYDARGPTKAMHRREISYAVADTRCQFRRGLAAVYAEAFRRSADRLSNRTRQLLVHLLTVVHRATQQAHRIAPHFRRG